MEQKNEISSYIQTLSLILLCILFVAFPLVVTTVTTDSFILPKQIFLGVSVLLSFILLGVRMITDGKVVIRRTPFDIPLIIFTLVLLAPPLAGLLFPLFVPNRYDSLIALTPLLFAVVSYFVIVQIAREKQAVFMLLSSLTLGAVLLSVLNVLTLFKIYILPFEFAKVQTFTPIGALLDQAIYLVLVLPIAVHFAFAIKNTRVVREIVAERQKEFVFTIASIIITIGLLTTMYKLVALQRPYLLPFETGFQTAMAQISQDTPRLAQGFLVGSGYGNFITTFNRFKLPTFNLTPVWFVTFGNSSSFVLEILATTGVLGLVAFGYLLFRVLREFAGKQSFSDNAVVGSVILAFLLAFLLPFSFVIQATLLLLLGLFAASHAFRHHGKFFDIELEMVALRKGLFALNGEPVTNRSATRILPIAFFAFFILFAGLIGFFSVTYVLSDITFQKSLAAAAQNNGNLTYQYQQDAIKTFPYREGYYRIFSQTNLALANSISSQQPQVGSPSADVQNTLYALIQQSITNGRTATSVSPLNVTSWQNLASVYRALIGFGQNAEQFAVQASQQAIALDPNNPQEYINLGGIFYQLGQYENAQNQFQIAVRLKPDFANAYYNLGHALENKADLEGAMQAYQTVKTLVGNDKEALAKVNSDIEMVQKKMNLTTAGNEGGQMAPQQATESAEQNTNNPQAPLEVNTPQTKLPEQKKQVEIPAPTGTLTPTPSPTKAPQPQ